MKVVYTQLPLFVTSKVCSKCRIERPLDQFPFQNKAENKLHPDCKVCRSLAYKGYKRPQYNGTIPPGMTEKWCPQCKKHLPCEAFHKRKRNKDGLGEWCKQCMREKKKQRYEKDPEGYREHRRQQYTQWTPERKAKKNAYQRSRASKNANYLRQRYQTDPYWKAHRSEYTKRRYETIPELRVRMGETGEAWRRSHPLQRAEASRRRTASKKGYSTGERVSYARILERDGYVCHICEQAILPYHQLHFDHVVPLTRGGAHSEDNIKPTHQQCNNRKHDKLMEELTPFDRRGVG
jgi:5-methylcytosine-specific restriction endonuclease McrA